MRKIILLILVSIILSMSLSVISFGYENEYGFDEEYYGKFKGQKITINVYNWGEYISDGSDDTLNVNKEFEALTGIKVQYTTYATNEELYAKLKSGVSGYDIVIPSEYMVARMINEGMLEELNMDAIPNFVNIDDRFKYQPHDPQNKFSVPYTWGTVGIIYNTTMVDTDADVESWDILWDPNYIGEILMFSNPRDAFGIAFRKLGNSLNPSTTEEIDNAAEALKEQKLLVQAYVMDEIFDKMTGGEAAIAPYYAGDAITMISDNPDLAFAHPREGTNIFIDTVGIPKGSKNKSAAEMYINFLCEPVVSAANAEYIGYSCPNVPAMEILDEEITSNPISYPSEEILNKTEFFIELPSHLNLHMDKMWTVVLSSDVEYSKWTIPIIMLLSVVASISINVIRTKRRKRDDRNYNS